jgi:hypothetical protein
MSEAGFSGGCLCGAVRYQVRGEPGASGYCFCADCRKASGSGFIPFINVPAETVTFSGETLQFRSRSFRGTDAVRNSCPGCGGLVFGGIVGVDVSHTIYAGSLDDPAVFRPRIAIFGRDRPEWVPLPQGVTVFETMPG